jgi:hypothetical protein
MVTGSVQPLEKPQVFQPDGIRWLEHFFRRLGQPTSVRMREPHRACLDCGLVWNNLKPSVLRGVIQREGIVIGLKEQEPEI